MVKERLLGSLTSFGFFVVVVCTLFIILSISVIQKMLRDKEEIRTLNTSVLLLKSDLCHCNKRYCK